MAIHSDTQPDLTGLDFDFLRYMEVRPDVQRTIQEFYLPRFQRCKNVIDLGCGDGDFIKLLQDNGIQAVGVDFDTKAYEAGENHDLPIIQDDVFHYLRNAQPSSVDGIFCAHLVEHLPYKQVVELIELSYNLLMPGGIIVLATPDARSLFSHLEMFYLHFGHVSFYHPRLLTFFLDHAGFIDTEFGVNPNTASPLLVDLHDYRSNLMSDALRPRVSYRPEIPAQGTSIFSRVSYTLKRKLTRWLVQPLLDDMTIQVNEEFKRTRKDVAAELQLVSTSIQSLNGPFECYALAYKPPMPSPQIGAGKRQA